MVCQEEEEALSRKVKVKKAVKRPPVITEGKHFGRRGERDKREKEKGLSRLLVERRPNRGDAKV